MDGMRTKTKVLSLAAILTGSVVFGMILAGSLDFTRHASAQKTAAAPAAASSSPVRAPQAVGLPSFADIAEQVMPAIVSVTATDIIKADKRRRRFHNFGNPDGADPFEFFRARTDRGGGNSTTTRTRSSSRAAPASSSRVTATF